MRHSRTTTIERRRFLTLLGWMPFAMPTLFALVGCGRGEEQTTRAGAGAQAGDTASAEASGKQPEPAQASPTAPATDPPQSAGSTASAAETGSSADRLVTEIAAMQTTVEALNYTNETSKPDQRCSNCRFYTAQGDAGRGSCQLFAKGLVTAEGWCASWQARPDAA